MAEPLSTERAGPNLTRTTFMEYLDRYDGIDDELIDAQETVRSVRRRRKDLRKVIKADGINLDEFDRARADAKRSGEEREAADKAYRQYMAWLQKPVGFQTSMFDLPAEPDVHELKRIDREGFDAGKAGHKADANSWTPGTEAHARWHSAWLRGQSVLVSETIQPTEPPPKRRGRPPKNGAAASPDPHPPGQDVEGSDGGPLPEAAEQPEVMH